MSIQSIEVSCSRCDFHGSAGVSHGIFKYETPDGLVDCPRELGWCESCGGLAPIEALPTEERVSRIRGLLRREEDSLSASEKADEAAKPGWRKVLGLRPAPSTETRIWRDLCESRRGELERLIARNKTFGTFRKPRCLRCGSDSVTALPSMPSGLDPELAETQRPLPIGMKHPGCGGELMAAYSPIRLIRRFTTKIFSTDGTYLGEKE